MNENYQKLKLSFNTPYSISADAHMPTGKYKNNGYDCIINKTQVQKPEIDIPEIDTIKYKFHSKIPLIGWFIDMCRNKDYTESEADFNDRIKTNNLTRKVTRNIYENNHLVRADEFYMSDEDYEKYTQYEKDCNDYVNQAKSSKDKQEEASCYLNYDAKGEKLLDLRLRLANILNSHRVVVKQTIYKI